jgi:hypothetical protein
MGHRPAVRPGSSSLMITTALDFLVHLTGRDVAPGTSR